MAMNGLLLEVRWQWDGTQLSADVAAGETTLPVVSPDTLAEGSQVWVEGSGPYTVGAVHPAAGTVALTAPLSAPCEDGSPVVPDAGGQPAQVWVAAVMLPDARMPIEVGLTVHDLSVMQEGVYDPPVAIVLSDDLQSVVDLPGQLPVINGGLIDPETLPDSGNDTPPPSASPVPQVFSGSGAAVVRWDHVIGATSYTLHSSPDGLAPPSEATVHTNNASSPMFVADVPLDADTYFAVQANSDTPEDDPAPSEWVAGRAGPIDPSMLTASLALIEQVIAEIVETQGIKIGTGSWDEAVGFNIPDVVSFPSTLNALTEAYLRAHMNARSLTVENFFKLLGTINEIASGAGMVLANGVTDPSQPPLVEPYWHNVVNLQTANAAALKGLYRHVDSLGVVSYFTGSKNSNGGYVDKYNDQGILVDNQYLGLLGEKCDPVGGVVVNTVDGVESIYALCLNTTSQIWEVLRVNMSLTQITARWSIGPITKYDKTLSPAIAPFATGAFAVVAVETAGADSLIMDFYDYANPPASSYARLDLGVKLNHIAGAGITYPGGGYPGSQRMIVWPQNADPWVFEIASDNETTATEGFPRAYGKSIRGAHGMLVLDSAGQIWEHTIYPISGSAAYSYRDTDAGGTGEHETGLSEAASLADIPKGAMVKITPGLPGDTGDADSPNVSTVYTKTATGQWRQVAPDVDGDEYSWVYRTQITDFGTIHGSRPSFASAGVTPAWIRSAVRDPQGDALVDLRGDGSWRLGDLEGAADGTVTMDGQPLGGGVAVPDSAWRVVGTAGNPGFTSPWTEGGGAATTKFRRFADGNVMISVEAQGGGNNTTIFTLPEGYRPAETVRSVICFQQGASPPVGTFDILSTGEVKAFRLGQAQTGQMIAFFTISTL